MSAPDVSRDIVQPRTLKGFRDFLPEAAIARERLIAATVDVYRRYGFSPIDTPALEYTEVLLGKGSDESDKQMYRFDDPGGRDVAMRFDLTVPLARFVAQHVGALGTPFKRYHVGPVWRGESPQRGRYREFLQCDFDTIGTESTMADIETALVIADVFAAVGVERFTVRVNNRKVLSGLLERLGLTDQSAAVLRAIDKLPKIGDDAMADELRTQAGATAAQTDHILRFVGFGADVQSPGHGSAALDERNTAVITAMADLVAGSVLGERGVAELDDVRTGVQAATAPGRLVIDPAIARGLDYYTGTVFETFLDELPDIGSCMSGGRYDDLASVYTKQRLPGVGASLGVDRLLAALEELADEPQPATWAPVLVTRFDAEGTMETVRMAAELRRAGIGTEVYPDLRKLGTQLKYADRRGHRFALIAGPEERAAASVQIKELSSGDATTVDRTELVTALQRRLESPPR